MVKILTKCCC